MQINFSSAKIPVTGTVIFVTSTPAKLKGHAETLDKITSGALSKAIKSSNFKGEAGSTLSILSPASTKLERVILLGVGDAAEIDALSAESTGGKLYAVLNTAQITNATLIIDPIGKTKLNKASLASHIGYGALLRSYRFNIYRTNLKDSHKAFVKKLAIHTEDSKKANTEYKSLKSVVEGVNFARDLVSEPPNKLYPASYAKKCQTLSKLGIKVKVLGEKEMTKLGMGALLGVGQGSARESKLVVMEYKGARSKKGPVAFVGKGVTFDTGGISLKPSVGMEDMKYDMGGSAAVVGTMKALAGRKAKVHAVGIVGLVENMPGSNAQRPSDVVSTMSKQTVEVLNTDAEGRLVLADALTYVQRKYKPCCIVDLATLTGAIVIALGGEYAGTFSNNDKLATEISDAGDKSGDKVWRFPLGEAYDKTLDSPIADMQNISSERGAGSITAAQFLQRFIENDLPWIHIDIAGVAWTKKDLDTTPKGAVGWGVKLLNQWIADNHES